MSALAAQDGARVRDERIGAQWQMLRQRRALTPEAFAAEYGSSERACRILRGHRAWYAGWLAAGGPAAPDDEQHRPPTPAEVLQAGLES